MRTKLQNNFTSGIVDKDTDERLVPENVLVDAENFLVSTSNGQNGGVGKNVSSNRIASNLAIPGGKTIRSAGDNSNEKVYNFVSGTFHDQIIEHDLKTETSVVVVKSTVGHLLNFDPNKRILNVDIVQDPEGNGNLLLFSGDHNPPRCLNIETAKTWTVDGFSEQEISLIKAPPTYPLVLSPLISTENTQANYLEDRMLSFGYRYKFRDGFYSAISSWTKYFFTPGVFNLDFETFENLGMLNLYNAVNLSFNTGPRDVVGIELMFKLSNSRTPYVIDKFIKEDEGWGDNSVQTIEFNNSKVYNVLPESEYYRSFDNVPLSAVAQTMIGNRVSFGNYVEQRDIIDENGNKCLIDYTLSLVANNIATTEIEPEQITEDYSYDGPISLANGAIVLDLGDYTFNQGSSINIYFKLKSNEQVDTDFRGTFTYILTESYTNLSDFMSNSSFVVELQNYTLYFQTNGGVVFPNDYVPEYEVLQGFDAVVYTGDTIKITFPVIKYEIDETPDPNSFLFEYIYDNNSIVIISNIAVATSLKSLRSYEICMIYRDNEVRKTTALTSRNNTLFIPNENSITQNQIKVTIPSAQKPPFWAKTYKFGIKVNKQAYETIPINIYFVDGKYRWIKLDGENRNKIGKEGDILIVKRDKNGPLSDVVKVKVLELGFKEKNFLSLNSSSIVEPEGKYAKIKASNFQMQYDVDEFQRYEAHPATEVDRPIALLGAFTTIDESTGTVIDRTFSQGATVTFNFSSNFHNDPPFIEFVKTYTAQRAYDNFQQFFDEQIEPAGFESTNTPDKFYNISLKRGFRRWVIEEVAVGVVASINGSEIVLTSPLESKLTEGRVLYIYTGSQFLQAGTVESYDASTDTVIINRILNINVGEWFYVHGTLFPPAIPLGIEEDPDGFLWLEVEGTEAGSQVGIGDGKRGFLDAILDIRYVSGLYVFETKPLDADDEIFFETPEVYTIENGQHEFTDHILYDTFNCFCQGNGVESFQVRDAFNEKYLSIDFCPTAVSEDEYRQITRYADVTYSGIYNANTNVNRLNEFNLSLANFKDDVEKSYGPIYKLKGQDNNLEVYQEDKTSKIYYGKDLLYNADGTTNLSRIEEVLGQQDPDGGEYGISMHPDSFDDYAFNTYFTDVKRGVVIKKNYNNGHFEASSQRMRSYFKNLFTNNVINHINGKYDQYNDFYILNIQYNNTEYVTWVYSDKDNGWLGRLKFNPEDMCRVNGVFVSFKNGEMYIHNQENVRNTFYGVESKSKFDFYFSQEPSGRKNFYNIEIEGTIAPDVILKTDLNDGYINKADFERKEGDIFYAYVRNSNSIIDTKKLSTQGIGTCEINGSILEFSFEVDNIVSVGDSVYNQNMQIVGVIMARTNNTLTLNAVQNLSDGDYVLCQKTQSIQNNELLGRYMKVSCEFESNELQEIFAVNTVVSKSFP